MNSPFKAMVALFASVVHIGRSFGHSYEEINSKLIDLAIEHFSYRISDWEEEEERGYAETPRKAVIFSAWLWVIRKRRDYRFISN